MEVVMWTVKVVRSFSAAHFLSGNGGRCENMHGHNYRVEVTVGSDRLTPPGMVVDFIELRSKVDAILPDHRLLNEVYNFPPTAENLARHFYEELKKVYPVLKVTVWENEDCCAEYFED
jgi:6-pyruvoyltetrahydropterin/6-carboxytetrahydropterin synthase